MRSTYIWFRNYRLPTSKEKATSIYKVVHGVHHISGPAEANYATTVGQEGVVSVKDARHPILLLRKLEGVVGSDVDIGEGENQGLILTGPNSGGKTIILVSSVFLL